jgi:Family of unknown function (DUF6090)
MQEEIIKHSKKVYKSMKNKNHSFKEKVKEIMIEIFIIVFAVSLSIYLHSWSEHNHQQKEVQEFLVDLKSDLNEDIKAFKKETEMLNSNTKTLLELQKLTSKDYDVSKNLEIKISFTLRQTNIGNFEGFKSSGKIGYIENKKLKKDILEYFIQNMPPLYKIEDNLNENITELLKTIGNIENRKAVFESREVESIINLNIQYSNSLINAYKEDIRLAQTIIKEIDSEIQIQ